MSGEPWTPERHEAFDKELRKGFKSVAYEVLENDGGEARCIDEDDKHFHFPRTVESREQFLKDFPVGQISSVWRRYPAPGQTDEEATDELKKTLEDLRGIAT